MVSGRAIERHLDGIAWIAVVQKQQRLSIEGETGTVGVECDVWVRCGGQLKVGTPQMRDMQE
jgi:hypothetical protein